MCSGFDQLRPLCGRNKATRQSLFYSLRLFTCKTWLEAKILKSCWLNRSCEIRWGSDEQDTQHCDNFLQISVSHARRLEAFLYLHSGKCFTKCQVVTMVIDHVQRSGSGNQASITVITERGLSRPKTYCCLQKIWNMLTIKSPFVYTLLPSAIDKKSVVDLCSYERRTCMFGPSGQGNKPRYVKLEGFVGAVASWW